MPYPESASLENRGTTTYSDEGTGVADIIAASRKNIDGDFEWMPVTDSFQVSYPNEFLFTDLSVGGTEDLLGGFYQMLDLTDYREVRFYARVTVVGTATSVGFPTYSIDGGTSFDPLTTQTIDLDTLGVAATDWETLPVLARDIVLISYGASGGDGVEDPKYDSVLLLFRK
jgi:hypothetical protein